MSILSRLFIAAFLVIVCVVETESLCNYYNSSSAGGVIAVGACYSLGSTSLRVVCKSSTEIVESVYSGSSCSGKATNATVTGSTVHCGGQNCYAGIKAGNSCNNLTDIGAAIPFDVCVPSGSSGSVKISCAGAQNYSNSKCTGTAGVDYELAHCYDLGGGAIEIYDVTGYCSGTTATPTTTSRCSGTCYAALKIGTKCSNLTTILEYPFDVCTPEGNNTAVKVTCDGIGNYSSASCKGSESVLYKLGKCYTFGNYSGGFYDISGYCSSAFMNKNSLILSIILVVSLVLML